MVQTINVLSNGTVCINTGEIIVRDDFSYPAEVLEKLDEIQAAMALNGFSELHCEKDNFRHFEHAVKGGIVISNPFGTTLSDSNFALIMDAIADQVAAEAAEAAAAEGAAVSA